MARTKDLRSTGNFTSSPSVANRRASATKNNVRDTRYTLDSRSALKAFRLIGGFDGIQIDELRKVISTLSDSHVRVPLQKNLHSIFSQFDEDDNGILDMLEFENMMQSSTILTQAIYDLLERAEHEEHNEYMVEQSHDVDIAHYISVGNTMDIISVLVTLVYVLVLAIQLDVSPGWLGWRVVELIFLIMFSIEICGRCVWDLLKKSQEEGRLRVVLEFFFAPMTVFDLCVVVVGWVEIIVAIAENEASVATALRWVRLLRFARCLRLVRIFWYCRELRAVIEGILAGMKAASWGFALIFLIVFIWAVVIRTAVENNWTADTNGILAGAFPNTPKSILMVFRCMALSADNACPDKPDDFGWAFNLFWALSEALILVGIFNVVASVYVVQAAENEQKIKQSINYSSFREDVVRLQKLDRLLRTLIHPGRETSNPKDRNAAEVAAMLRTEHAEAAAKLPNLEMQLVRFAQNIQDARQLHQSAMDVYEAQEYTECKELRQIPNARTYMVEGEQVLLVDDDAHANNSLNLPIAPMGAVQVAIVQDQGNVEDLLEDAFEVQQFIKTVIWPNSVWAIEIGADSSGDIWRASRGLCDEAIDPGLKSPERIEQKVGVKYGGRYERNRDYCRLSLIYNSVHHLLQALPRFLEFRLNIDNFQVVSVENRFSEPHPLGWRDITLLLKVCVPSTIGYSNMSYHIMEVQMRLRKLAEVCHEGHQFYEEIRANLPEALVTTILDRLVTDTTLDLGITKAEWLQCLPNKEVKRLLDALGIPRRARKALFDIIDIDGSGTVTSSELQEMLLLVKDPVHAHEMAGCHFRVRDIQRQLQTRIEPQLAMINNFSVKCMGETEMLFEDLYCKLRDTMARETTTHVESCERTGSEVIRFSMQKARESVSSTSLGSGARRGVQSKPMAAYRAGAVRALNALATGSSPTKRLSRESDGFFRSSRFSRYSNNSPGRASRVSCSSDGYGIAREPPSVGPESSAVAKGGVTSITPRSPEPATARTPCTYDGKELGPQQSLVGPIHRNGTTSNSIGATSSRGASEEWLSRLRSRPTSSMEFSHDATLTFTSDNASFDFTGIGSPGSTRSCAYSGAS